MENTAKRPSSTLAMKALTEGALMVAAAMILGFIKLWEMPWGGSVNLGMLPILLYACRWGLGRGLGAGFVYGVLQFMFDGGFAIGWASIIGDYVLAYTVLGLAGVFVGKKWSVYAGTVLGCGARFLVHYVVGATIWAEYMPETFFGTTMTTPWVYSFLYNGCYMGIDLLLCLGVFALMQPKLGRYLTGADLK